LVAGVSEREYSGVLALCFRRTNHSTALAVKGAEESYAVGAGDVLRRTMDTIIQRTIHVVLALTMPPLLLGIIAKTKALFAVRVGPPLLQPYYDLIKLFQKGSVFSTATTWVFRAGPVVGLATALVAALLVPFAPGSAPLSFPGDPILLVYVLALGRFFTA